MSITSEIINSTKTGQAKALQKNAKKYTDSLTQITKDQNKELKSTTNSLIEGTRQEVQRSYDLNALNEEIQVQQVSDRMASLGLTDSGLNATQQTALASSRINADAQVSQSYNNAVATLRSNLQTAIAENNRTLQSNIAQVNYNTGVNSASITAEEKSSANEKTQSLISSITSTTDKATQAQLIFSAANTYGLSNTSINKLLSLTDITQAEYQSYLADKEYFSKKANTTTLNDLKTSLLSLDTTSGAGQTMAARMIYNYKKQYGLTDSQLKTICKTAGISYTTYNKWLEDNSYYTDAESKKANTTIKKSSEDSGEKKETSVNNGGTNYDNGGYKTYIVKQAQEFVGADADGYWGTNSDAAAKKKGYNSIAEVVEAMNNGGFVDISADDEKKASGAISRYSLFKYHNATEAMNRVDELLDEGIITDSVYASIIRQIGDYY